MININEIVGSTLVKAVFVVVITLCMYCIKASTGKEVATLRQDMTLRIKQEVGKATEDSLNASARKSAESEHELIEKMTEYSKQLVKNTNEHMTKMRTDLSATMEQKHQTSMSTVKADMTAEFGRMQGACIKVIKSDKEVNDILTSQILPRLDSRLKNFKATLETETSTQLKVLRKDLEGSIVQQKSELEAQVENLKKNLGAVISEKLKSLGTGLGERMESLKGSLSTQLSEKLKVLRAEIGESLKEQQAELDTRTESKLQAHRSSLQSSLSKLETDLSDLRKSTQQLDQVFKATTNQHMNLLLQHDKKFEKFVKFDDVANFGKINSPPEQRDLRIRKP